MPSSKQASVKGVSMIVPTHYENLKVLHENTMPNRSYYIPASVRRDDLVEYRGHSDRVQLLNGDWKFRYYKSIYDLQEPFYEETVSAEGYQDVQVSAVWQNYGCEKHRYYVINYPFPFDPPYVGRDNPCGAYIREFTYQKDEKAPKAYLNFEGVDSCFYVWINGRYVGYSQVSHSTSEFDVTDYVREGINKLAVLVLRWCDGTYMEDQDKFRMSGIFRDVYLLKRPENFIFDYFTTTKLTGDKAEVTVRIKPLQENITGIIRVYDVENHEVIHMDVVDNERISTTYDEEAVESKRISAENPVDTSGKTVENSVEKTAEYTGEKKEYPQSVTFVIENPRLWNAEEPYLYTMVLETQNEVITDRLGIREISVCDNVVMLNRKPIKFRGVNRHDSDPVTGFTISIEQMKKDLLVMRQHNVNAIRTSHYPNAPQFYQLCDEYGFYVMDEADNECNGAQFIYFKDNSWENSAQRWGETISDHPDFIETIVDRTQRCVIRDKNRPCVLMWSMGNESGYGCGFEEALRWTKAYDPDRLTHYESLYYKKGAREYDFSNLDTYSRMYPPMKDITDYLDHEPDKPFVMCEYSHAMGNGPGDLEDYFELIEKYDAFCGGFVWEWCDHAIYAGQADDGRAIYQYGGDNGEINFHSTNCCMDGLVWPDRRPHTGLLEFKNVSRPARVVSFENGLLTLHNYKDFVDLKEYLTIDWEVNCDGTIVSSGRIAEADMVSVKPHEDGTLSLLVSVPEKGKCYLKVYYRLKQETQLLTAGHLLGFDEVLLQNADGENQMKQALLSCCVSPLSMDPAFNDQLMMIRESEKYIAVSAPDFYYEYNKFTGLFEQMSHRGRPLITRPMEINIWRAPTDNDRIANLEWTRARFHWSVVRAYETNCEMIPDENGQKSICITSTLSVAAPFVQRILDIFVKWTINIHGKIRMEMDVKKNPEFPVLPRFGIRMFLPEDMQQVTYYGMGPQESYVDKHRGSSHGKYTANIGELLEDYVRPQENGSHYDCDYVVLQGTSAGLAAVSDKTFCFNASVYTQEELAEKRHNYELIPCGDTVLCLDHAHNGIGSNSCGPALLEKYWFEEEKFQFMLELIPLRLS